MRTHALALVACAVLFLASTATQAATLQVGFDGNGGPITWADPGVGGVGTGTLSGTMTGTYHVTSGLSNAGLIDTTAVLHFRNNNTNAVGGWAVTAQTLDALAFDITNAAGTITYITGNVALASPPFFPAAVMVQDQNTLAVTLSTGDQPPNAGPGGAVIRDLVFTSPFALGPIWNEQASFTSNAGGYELPPGVPGGLFPLNDVAPFDGVLDTLLFKQLSGNLSAETVPEPGSLALLLSGGVAGSALLAMRRRRA